MATFDFTKTFEKIGTQFVRGLRDGIVKQRGLDGGAYPPPTQATLEMRKQKTGKKGGALKSSSSMKRMYVTGDTAREAFSFVAKPNGVSVFALKFNHKDGDITYSDIIKDNSRGLRGSNPNIKESNKPLIFPSKPDEIKMMKKEFEFSKKIFEIDAVKMLREMAKMNLKVKLNVG